MATSGPFLLILVLTFPDEPMTLLTVLNLYSSAHKKVPDAINSSLIFLLENTYVTNVNETISTDVKYSYVSSIIKYKNDR